MQYNGIKGKSLKLQEGDALLEMRYDASSSDQTGAFISKDGGVSFEKLLGQSDGSILKPFTPDKQYVENEMIIEDGVIYTRKTAGISAATLGDDIANWEPQTRLHTSGSRYVKFKIDTATYPAVNTWAKQDFIYVDGDQSMVGSNTLIVPADGLYYAHMFPFSVLPSAGSSIIRLTNASTGAVYMANISGAMGASNYKSQSGFDTILHLSKGTTLSVELYTTVKATASSSIPCEFGLIAEDQSDNVVAEATYTPITSVTTTSERAIALENITNPSAISSDGKITLPEDGTYILSGELYSSNSGGTSGTVSLFVRGSDKSLRMQTPLYTGTNVQIPSFTTILSGNKGDTFTITTQKSVAQSNLTSGVARYVRLFKLKSVTTSLSSQDLYNEYLQKLPASETPNSYEDWLKSLISRSQLRVKAKVVNQTRSTTGLIQHQFTYVEGEQSMLNSNNCFVAPVAGLYSIDIPSFATTFSHGASTPGTTTIFKGTTNIDSAYIGFSYTNGTVTIPSCNPIVWLGKGETVSVWWNEITTDSITLLRNNYDCYAEFSLIQGGHPLENYPNTWTPGVEYDFGNGLYGQRFIGTYTVAKATRSDIILDSSLIPASVVDWGGQIQESDWYVSLPHCFYSNSAVDEATLWWSSSSSTTLRIAIQFQAAQTNSAYDVWVKYTK